MVEVSSLVNESVEDTEEMQTEPIKEKPEPSPAQSVEETSLADDIDIVAAENGGVHKMKRIDNGMVVRNKKIGDRSPKFIRSFGK